MVTGSCLCSTATTRDPVCAEPRQGAGKASAGIQIRRTVRRAGRLLGRQAARGVRSGIASSVTLAAHDLIATLAGDAEARTAIRGQGSGAGVIPGPDQAPLADEFLVLDADSSQNYAINAVLAGRSLIVKGPPGTGKSQTIANLIGNVQGARGLRAGEPRGGDSRGARFLDGVRVPGCTALS
jgi:hypothetical protein